MNKWTGLLWALLSCIYVQYRRTIDKLKQDACFLQLLCQYSSVKCDMAKVSSVSEFLLTE